VSITTYIAPISDGVELVKKLLISEFEITDKMSEDLAGRNIKQHFDKLLDTCYLVAETSYVDKVYRDSYYHYYASKLGQYKRDSIRLSIFDGEIKETDFRQASKIKELQEKYRGFIILRPTEPFVIGRSLISPKALKSNTFLCCSTKIQTSAYGVKFEVEGFPHSSQDTETISCAETTLWAVMEYFGNKYAEYKPILPSKIIETLNKVTSERQLPSKGLNIQQMSFALREFGFGTRIYARDDYNNDFEKLISTYVESGIPLILGIDDRHTDPPGNIGHAILCVGHEKISNAQIDALPANEITNAKLRQAIINKRLSVYDLDGAKKEFVFIDDNFPAYQKSMLGTPSSLWNNCTIKHFIVPLYHKIYLEAYEAKNFVLKFLIQGAEPFADNSEVLIKHFLTSSRSFKDGISLNDSFQEDVKDMIIETPMPKFIWVTEISDKNLMKTGQANGIVILDATEANIHSNYPLIFAAYQGKQITFEEPTRKLKMNILPLRPFNIYTHNLRNL